MPAEWSLKMLYITLDTGVMYLWNGSAYVAVGWGWGGWVWWSITGTLADQTDLASALTWKASAIHTHIINDITGLQTALDWKSNVGHTHDDRYYTESETDTLLAWKSSTWHTHVIADVTGLQTALDWKASTTHNHDSVYYTETEVNTLLSGKADSVHNHDDRYFTESEVSTLVSNSISAVIDAAPGTLDTLNELANALGDDPNFATTVATAIGNKMDNTTTAAGTLLNSATEKTTPVDADMFSIIDSAASFIMKKLSWSNIKATLKTYFDGIYVTGPASSTNNHVAFYSGTTGKQLQYLNTTFYDWTHLVQTTWLTTQRTSNDALIVWWGISLYGSIRQIGDGNYKPLLTFSTTNNPSAVNNLHITHASTWVAPKLEVVWSDANINLEIKAKGTWVVNVTSNIQATNLSGTNTWDNAPNSLYSGLATSKQDTLTLTTTGSSWPATLIGSTLNIPNYAWGGGWSVNGGTFQIDFGNNANHIYYISQVVTDANVTPTSKVLATYSWVPWREADEIEFVSLKVWVSDITTGQFTVHVADDATQAEWIYEFTYILL